LRWTQALIQNPQAVPREELRLGDLVILLRSAVTRGERIGGGPIHHARFTELECLAGSSAPCLVTPHHAADTTPRTPPRAELRPSTRPSHGNSCGRTRGSVNSLETGSESELGNMGNIIDAKSADSDQLI
jgi:hypothetical protein